ncbi:MAG: sensor domain-containing diguanylate cyclase [Acidimicrobiales bacterium]
MVHVPTDKATHATASDGTVRDETLALALAFALGEFAQTLSSDFPVQGILDHFVKRIVTVLPITSAGVTLISAGVAPRYVAASDDAALRFEQLQSNIGEGPCVRAYETGEPVVVADLRLEQRFPKFAPAALTAGLGAVFTFPLHDGDYRVGALDLYRDSPGALDAQDMSAARILADVAAAYLRNARARDELVAAFELLKNNALRDPLTGLVNRVLLQDRIEHAAHIASGSALAAILFANVDDFNSINDTHGHQLGDQLLRAIAERLVGVVASAGTVARFGDDKFVVVCEHMNSEADVDAMANCVDAALSEPFALIGADQPLTLTATIAVAFAGSANAMSFDTVLQADQAIRTTRKKKRHSAHQLIDLRPERRTT